MNAPAKTVVQLGQSSSPADQPILLLDLPEEIIVAILLHLPDIELYLCAQTSQILNRLAVSLILTNEGIRHPHDHCRLTINPRFDVDALSALLISVHIRRVNRITYDLVAFSSYGDLGPSFFRLSRLLTMLTSVQEVSIYLKHYGIISYNDEQLKRMARTLEDLLNTIVLKSCTRLRILGSKGLFGNHYQFLTGDKTPKAMMNVFQHYVARRKDGTVETPITADDWRYCRTNYGSRVFLTCSPEALERTRLYHINIGTVDILLPPFSRWTFTMLHASPITSLSAYFESLPDNPQELQFVLSRLAVAVPRLTRIYLDKIKPTMIPNILVWINQFSRLETLEIYPFILNVELAVMEAFTLDLNKLRWLAAAPQLLSYIACHPVKCPSLEYISIDCSVARAIPVFDPLVISKAVADIRQWVFVPKSTIRIYFKFNEDLSSIIKSAPKPKAASSSVADEVLDNLKIIKDVRIKLHGRREDLQNERFIAVVLSYLNMFPNVNKFRLTLLMDSDETTYVADKFDDEFHRAIRSRCPSIRDIDVK